MLARLIDDFGLTENDAKAGGGPDWEGPWPQTPPQFERLIDCFQGRLFRYALRRLGSVPDAEDLVQELFIQAYAERERRRGVVHVRAYLYRMAAHACQHWLRRRGRGPVMLDAETGAEIRDHRPTPAASAAAAETAARIEGLLRRIPEPQAEVIRLRFFDELRFVEIAEVIGSSVATVKSRLRYGLEKLQHLIGKEPA